MSGEPASSARDSWVMTATAVTAAIAVASALAGFLWLPSWDVQGNVQARFAGVWDTICGAAGLVRATPAPVPMPRADPGMTQVVMTSLMPAGVDGGAIGRGATLAMQCTMCHGARGMSEADSPNLAGQNAPMIHKQLRDYKSGARASAVMSPRVASLTEQDMRDLAVYYAYLPRLPTVRPITSVPVPRLVANGAPMRSIAPCASCHGTLNDRTGSAWLEGQSPVYLQAQLEAFASGARRNDIGQQMRNVARGMSRAEREEAARYYANQP